MPRPSPCTGWLDQRPSAGDSNGSATHGQQGGALAPPQARHPRASRRGVPSLRAGCFPTSQPRAADPSGRRPNAGGCSGRSPPKATPPTAPDRNGAEAGRSAQDMPPPAAEARPPADARVAGAQLRSRGSRWRLLLAGHPVQLAVSDSEKDHRQGVVGTAVLRAETNPIGKPPIVASIDSGLRANGGQRCRELTRAASAARSTPANPPRKGSSRNSTRFGRRAKRARLTSAARVTRAGYWPEPATTLAGSRAAAWTGRRCSACSPTSGPGGSTSSHAVKKGRRYRSYVSAALITEVGTDRAHGWRLAAHETEDAVT